jgi:hypothetical protein
MPYRSKINNMGIFGNKIKLTLSIHLNERTLRIIVLELETYTKVLESRNTQSIL